MQTLTLLAHLSGDPHLHPGVICFLTLSAINMVALWLAWRKWNPSISRIPKHDKYAP